MRRSSRTVRRPRVFVVGSRTNKAHLPLAAAWAELGIDVVLISGDELRAARIDRRDVLIGRLDVLPTLDGVEPGLFELLLLERSGFRVANGACSLVAAHDKLVTARRLERAGIPHPRTTCVRRDDATGLQLPVVVKPRFGSWGKDVVRCETSGELAGVLRGFSDRSWFRRHGALVQELVPPRGTDLRLIVAGGEVVGAAERSAPPGEWRTNVALGATVRAVDPPAEACELALAAARELACDFVGVDLLSLGPSGHVVLELNGAVEFGDPYSLPGRDVFHDVACALGLVPTRRAAGGATPCHHRRPARVPAPTDVHHGA